MASLLGLLICISLTMILINQVLSSPSPGDIGKNFTFYDTGERRDKHRDRQTQRQIDRQTERQTDSHTDRQTDRQTIR